MSAAAFGASVLDEVQEESLDQLLLSLRSNLRSHDSVSLQVPPLDSLLATCHESSLSSISDPIQHRSSPELLHESHHEGDSDEHINAQTEISESRYAVYEAPMIELAHSDSSAAKAKLLYHITAASILPRSHGGNEGAVVWLDTESRFSATELHRACLTYTNKSTSTTRPSISDATAEASLQYVHVFPIQSSRQLLAILENLHLYLLNTSPPQAQPANSPARLSTFLPTHSSHHRPLSLIILDSADTFHWPDRFDTEMARLESIRAPGITSTSSTTQPDPAPIPPTPQTLLTHLHRLRTTFTSPVLYTTNPSLTQTPPRPTPYQPAPEPDPWTTAATLSLTLTRIPVPQFASHMRIDECLRDREKRLEAVRRNRVRVGVDEEWLAGRKGLRERLARVRARGAFVVRWDGPGGKLVVEDGEKG